MGSIEFEMPISHPEGDVKSAGEYMTSELRSWLEKWLMTLESLTYIWYLEL